MFIINNIQEYIGGKVKYYRDIRKLTQDDLALVLDTTRQAVSRYEQGARKLSSDALYELASFFDVTINDFFPPFHEADIVRIYNQLNNTNQTKVYDFAEKKLNEQIDKIEGDTLQEEVKTVVTSRRTAAGSALYVDDNDARKEVVSSALIPKGADELVEVVGQSMEPLIKDGQEVYIRYQPSVENGEIAIVRIENEGVTCKRVYRNDGTITLKSENKEYSDMHFDSSQVTVLGKVLI